MEGGREGERERERERFSATLRISWAFNHRVSSFPPSLPKNPQVRTAKHELRAQQDLAGEERRYDANQSVSNVTPAVRYRLQNHDAILLGALTRFTFLKTKENFGDAMDHASKYHNAESKVMRTRAVPKKERLQITIQRMKATKICHKQISANKRFPPILMWYLDSLQNSIQAATGSCFTSCQCQSLVQAEPTDRYQTYKTKPLFHDKLMVTKSAEKSVDRRYNRHHSNVVTWNKRVVSRPGFVKMITTVLSVKEAFEIQRKLVHNKTGHTCTLWNYLRRGCRPIRRFPRVPHATASPKVSVLTRVPGPGRFAFLLPRGGGSGDYDRLATVAGPMFVEAFSTTRTSRADPRTALSSTATISIAPHNVN
ncbi:hypothetical protein J6590_049444 [Homalodisca vitripennis]|nr:hypothetical protein J6590_049444 [Homalodisca vitripennis]